jgi:hypothetical protein
MVSATLRHVRASVRHLSSSPQPGNQAPTVISLPAETPGVDSAPSQQVPENTFDSDQTEQFSAADTDLAAAETQKRKNGPDEAATAATSASKKSPTEIQQPPNTVKANISQTDEMPDAVSGPEKPELALENQENSPTSNQNSESITTGDTSPAKSDSSTPLSSQPLSLQPPAAAPATLPDNLPDNLSDEALSDEALPDEALSLNPTPQTVAEPEPDNQPAEPVTATEHQTENQPDDPAAVTESHLEPENSLAADERAENPQSTAGQSPFQDNLSTSPINDTDTPESIAENSADQLTTGVQHEPELNPGQPTTSSDNGPEISIASLAEPAESSIENAPAPAAPASLPEIPPVAAPQPAPDVNRIPPDAGLAVAATLQPAQAARVLGDVGRSITTTTEREATRLKEQTATIEVGGDGSGGTATASSAPPEQPTQKTPVLPTADSSDEIKTPPRPDLTQIAPPVTVPAPPVANLPQGEIQAETAARYSRAIATVPTTDPGLSVPSGPPPVLVKTGESDPQRMQDQQELVAKAAAEQQLQGAADAAAAVGENDVRDRSAPEKLRLPELQKPKPQTTPAIPENADETVGLFAELKHGRDSRSANNNAKLKMQNARSEHFNKTKAERQKNSLEFSTFRQENAKQQAKALKDLKSEVGEARSQWLQDQQVNIDENRKTAETEISRGDEKINQEELQANEKSATLIHEGEVEAQGYRKQAESDAVTKKQQAEQASDGIFSWLGSQVKAFFNALTSAITFIFEAARKKIRATIQKFQELATQAIEAARGKIVSLIKDIGNTLIDLGDALLASFPIVRKKWRTFIQNRVNDAEKTVNQLAEYMTRKAKEIIAALGKAFDFLLGLYQMAMIAALEAAQSAVQAAMTFAKTYVSILGAFATVAVDIAAAPAQWMKNLGDAVIGGIRDHLWIAFRDAVKTWFNDKLQTVFAVGPLVWNLLRKGGISLQQIGMLAFEALKTAIPIALIRILTEKLVAMIIPAAGAVIAIIEAIQAAWPAIQRIIAAIAMFVAFLKAIKAGGAGPQFAGLLAAGAVVVIDFAANWLLQKLGKAIMIIAGKISKIAAKIAQKLKSSIRTAGRKFKKVALKLKRKLRKFPRTAKKRRKTTDKNKKQNNEQRLRKVVASLRPKIKALYGKGKISGLILKGLITGWRILYRLTSLALEHIGGLTKLVARINPYATVEEFVQKHLSELIKLLYKVTDEFFNKIVKEHSSAFRERIQKNGPDESVDIKSGLDSLLLAEHLAGEKGASHLKPGSSLTARFASGGTATVKSDPLNRSRNNKTVPNNATPGQLEVKGPGQYLDHPERYEAGTANEIKRHQHAVQSAIGGKPDEIPDPMKDFGAQETLLKIVEISRNRVGGLISYWTTYDAARSEKGTKSITAKALQDNPMTGLRLKPVKKPTAPQSLTSIGKAPNTHHAAEKMIEEPRLNSIGRELARPLKDENDKRQLVSRDAVKTANQFQKKVEQAESDGREVQIRSNAHRQKQFQEQVRTFVVAVVSTELAADKPLFDSEQALDQTIRDKIKKAFTTFFKRMFGIDLND